MVTVPSLERSTYLTDPLSVIVYTIRRYARQPKDTVPILSDEIISLTWQISRFGDAPDTLTSNIESDLQKVFDRIFNGERAISVSCSYDMVDTISYNILLSVSYTTLSGEVQQLARLLPIVNGRLVIPEDTI